jgi:hypothetical protein
MRPTPPQAAALAFAAILLFAAIRVITSRNPVHAALFLKGFQDSPLLSNGPHLSLGLAGVVLGWWPWRAAAAGAA